MQNPLENVKKFVTNKLTVAITSGAAAGVAAVLIVNKKTSMQLLLNSAHAKKMMEEGGRMVFDTPRGIIKVRVAK